MSAPGSAAHPRYTFQPGYLAKEKQVATKFRFLQPRFSIRELTWKVSPALRTSSECRLLLLSWHLSQVWHSQASLKGGTEPKVWPTAPKSELHWKDLWEKLKAAFYNATQKWSHSSHLIHLGTFLFWYTTYSPLCNLSPGITCVLPQTPQGRLNRSYGTPLRLAGIKLGTLFPKLSANSIISELSALPIKCG